MHGALKLHSGAFGRRICVLQFCEQFLSALGEGHGRLLPLIRPLPGSELDMGRVHPRVESSQVGLGRVGSRFFLT